jgi:hypothetical protein
LGSKAAVALQSGVIGATDFVEECHRGCSFWLWLSESPKAIPHVVEEIETRVESISPPLKSISVWHSLAETRANSHAKDLPSTKISTGQPLAKISRLPSCANVGP